MLLSFNHNFYHILYLVVIIIRYIILCIPNERYSEAKGKKLAYSTKS